MTISREIHLKSRPIGLPTEDNFELVERPLPEPAAGEVLVRNLYMSVDPYMRGRMYDRKSYQRPFQIGQPLSGGCVGQVIGSRSEKLPEGSHVLGWLGWREYYTASAERLTPVDPDLMPLSAYLGVAGMPGFTAYYGLLDIGQPQAGETVFVSGAAGAVGSAACQIAKIKGCRVVGSAGSAEKVGWLTETAGIDAALNYKEVDRLRTALADLCPEGIDVYFDNVGGEHLEAALANMNDRGRIVACGMIGQYNATQRPAAPSNLNLVVTKRLKMQGYIISDHYDQLPRFLGDMAQWIAAGQIKWEETVVEGLENAPQAFIGLFEGRNLGKMIVKL